MHRLDVSWLDAMSRGAASKPTVMNDFSVQALYTDVHLPDLPLVSVCVRACVHACVCLFYDTKKLASNFT